MVEKSGHWTRGQLLVALNLYCQLPFGKFHSRNPVIVKFAELLGRTPSALAMKLVNIASLDPVITESGRTGLVGASKLDRQLWDEMQSDWNGFAIESQTAVETLILTQARATLDTAITEVIDEAESHVDYSAENRNVQTESRIGQHFFRRAVLSAYAGRCCMTGLAYPRLLVASHIVPWRSDKENRLNPRNGLCLSVLHDRAFDQGLITITPDYVVKTSKSIFAFSDNRFSEEWLVGLDGVKIVMPDKFSPSIEFIDWHNKHVFLLD